MPVNYPSCSESENVVCKHARATKTFYVNLDFLPTGVTVVSATADTEDATLAIDTVEVLQTDLTVDESQGCAGFQLEADRAILVVLSGGTSSEDEVIVTVNWVQSDGDEDSRDCRVLVTGTASP
jgi:hypothetical protein